MVMTQKSFLKDLVRSIVKSRARFLSILAIIALGVGFYAGINATEPDMILSADQYYKANNLSDFHLISPLGFAADAITAVRQTSGVQMVQTGYTRDAFLTFNGGASHTVKLFSANAADSLNRPVILDGRMPANSGEIAIESSMNVPEDIRLGSVVTIALPEGEAVADSFRTASFTVVGRINSPLYIDFERGQTNIGDGSIGFFAYIPEADFTLAKITDLYVRTTDSAALTAYSEAYAAHLTAIKSALEDLGTQAISAETAQLRADLSASQAELAANRDQAAQELAAAEQQLTDAEAKIDAGDAELNSQEARYTREMADQEARLAEGQAAYAAGLSQYQTGYAQWQAGWQSYQTGADQLAASKTQLDEAGRQIAANESKLAAAKTELDAAARQIKPLQDALVVLNKIQASLPGNLPALTSPELDQLVAALQEKAPRLADLVRRLYQISDPNLLAPLFDPLKQALADFQKLLAASVQQYEMGLAQYEAGAAELAAGKTAYAQGLAEYQAGQQQLAAAKARLDSSKAELDQAKATLDASQVQLQDGAIALAQGEKTLNSRLDAGRTELAAARDELAAGRAAFETEKLTAEQKLADAEAQLKDAARKILEIPAGWYVLTRDGNPGYSGYGDDARRIGAVARVFPLFFFLVAALVCLTTMTRMVEEERVQIGTLKALGYSTLKIASKYLTYALLASLTGALAGLAIGFRLFPALIMGAYGIMYQIPVRLTTVQFGYAAMSIGLAVVTTVAAALLATLQELRAEPAVLMQPKAPKPGKRIFLERIKPLWQRLSFSHKVTARNIFRYKKRFLMTVIGIAGCTALLVTGFGLRDSIGAIVGTQFGKVFLYDGLLAFNTDTDAGTRDPAVILGENPAVGAWLNVLNETVSARKEGSDRTFEATLLVPSDVGQMAGFYDLHNRQTGAPLPLTSDGAVISEKLAGLLGVGVGDSFTWQDSEKRTYTIRVAGIAENYLAHYIYLSPEYFDIITLRTPQYNIAVFNLKDGAAIDQKAFKAELLSHDGVLGAIFTMSIMDEFADTIQSLDYVVLVLILSAGALAFVVLYNLTNINITERIREIATIKVLGFRDKEVSAYVYRENLVLTVIGALAGLLLGAALHRFVIGTMEIDSMMFGQDIHLLSFGLSIALTLAFALLVNIFMYYHLRRINMVESLKSVE